MELPHGQESNGSQAAEPAPRDPRKRSANTDAIIALTDLDLMRRLRAQDGDALTGLYDRYAATCHGLARSILRDDRLAEEVTHDVFLGLWQHPDRYDATRGPFAGWLFRVARNRAIYLFRRRREQPFTVTSVSDDGESIDPASFLVDTDPDPADQAVTTLMQERVRAGLAMLTADHRHLLELAYFGGLTQREIAAQLDRPLGTVKTQIRSAMRRLAEILADSSTETAASRVSHMAKGVQTDQSDPIRVLEQPSGAPSRS